VPERNYQFEETANGESDPADLDYHPSLRRSGVPASTNTRMFGDPIKKG